MFSPDERNWRMRIASVTPAMLPEIDAAEHRYEHALNRVGHVVLGLRRNQRGRS
jgi:hypothetical protein